MNHSSLFRFFLLLVATDDHKLMQHFQLVRALHKWLHIGATMGLVQG